MKKTFIIILVNFISICAIGQNSIEGKFKGWWASTLWEYEFKKDETFTYTSSGHFGYTVTKGKYKITGDTIILNAKGNRDKKPPAMEINNEKLIIDGDSCVIDYHLRYDYCNSNIQKRYYEFEEGVKSELDHNSRIRRIKYPQTKAKTNEEKEQLIKILNEALNDSILIKYYHFDNLDLSRKAIITSYFEINKEYETKIHIQNQQVEIKPISEISEIFYIEIEDININDLEIRIELRIKEEGIKSWILFKKDEDGKWKLKRNQTYEN